MRTADGIVLIATQTLEIGIDIGDIDLVVLDGPPPDIKSLLQRIGRGNRRSETTNVMLSADSSLDELINEALITSATNNSMGESTTGTHYAVAIQQVASYISQSPRRGRSRSQIENLLGFRFSSHDSSLIVANMIENEYIIENNNILTLSDNLEDRYVSGQSHSTIPYTPSINAIDSETGEVIATNLKSNIQKDSVVGISGRASRVSGITDQNVYLESVPGQIPDQTAWSYANSAWFVGSDHQTSVRQLLKLDTHIWPIVEYRGHDYIFHFGGARRKIFLTNIIGISDVNDWYIKTYANKLGKPPPPTTPVLPSNPINNDNIQYYEKRFARPSINRVLPMNLRVSEIESWLNIKMETTEFNESDWVSVTCPDLQNMLLKLVEFILE